MQISAEGLKFVEQTGVPNVELRYHAKMFNEIKFVLAGTCSTH
jgi:hypothetical protein